MDESLLQVVIHPESETIQIMNTPLLLDFSDNVSLHTIFFLAEKELFPSSSTANKDGTSWPQGPVLLLRLYRAHVKRQTVMWASD